MESCQDQFKVTEVRRIYSSLVLNVLWILWKF